MTLRLVDDLDGSGWITLDHGLRDKVKIDGEIAGIVTGIATFPTGTEYKVAWWNNGVHHSEWFADWRLTRVE